MKKLYKFLTSRMFIFSIFLILQIVLMVFLIAVLQERYSYVAITVRVLAILFVVVVVNKPINSAFKITWIIIILALPLVGVVLYFLLGNNRMNKIKKQGVKAAKAEADSSAAICAAQTGKEISGFLAINDPVAGKISDYIYNTSNYPVCRSGNVKYYPLGDDFYPDYLAELKKATKFIFMEFFIIERGTMWNGILNVLKEKARAGVDVRIIYDDVGCMLTLPGGYKKELESLGIKVLVFNKFKPIINVQMNNRTHRKITVIDGRTAFTGGVNLADEYINQKIRFGHWKDNAVMITGAGVNSFTRMFLNFWSIRGEEIDYSAYRTDEENRGDVLVQPFSDSPLDLDNVYENVYMLMLYCAKKYCYIYTPYLIISNEMKTAFETAVKSGVDVRIVVPHIPDKKTVFTLTRAFYGDLINVGVKVYEYTPGFVHSKTFVVDDKYCTVGTSNLDFRSLYLHFECGVFMAGASIAAAVKKDFDDTIASCREITADNIKFSEWSKVKMALLRLAAPLL